MIFFKKTPKKAKMPARRKPVAPPAVRLVVRYLDGILLKGTAADFSPMREVFHLRLDNTGEMKEIRIGELKAVFYVKDYSGNPEYRERKAFSAEDNGYGKKVEVEFSDGEVMAGMATSFNLDRQGFFLIPVDVNSNNNRVFVVSSAVRKVREI